MKQIIPVININNSSWFVVLIFLAGKHNRLWIWISVAIATALLIISISILYRARMKRKYMLGGIYNLNKFIFHIYYHSASLSVFHLPIYSCI